MGGRSRPGVPDTPIWSLQGRDPSPTQPAATDPKGRQTAALGKEGPGPFSGSGQGSLAGGHGRPNPRGHAGPQRGGSSVPRGTMACLCRRPGAGAASASGRDVLNVIGHRCGTCSGQVRREREGMREVRPGPGPRQQGALQGARATALPWAPGRAVGKAASPRGVVSNGREAAVHPRRFPMTSAVPHANPAHRKPGLLPAPSGPQVTPGCKLEFQGAERWSRRTGAGPGGLIYRVCEDNVPELLGPGRAHV